MLPSMFQVLKFFQAYKLVCVLYSTGTFLVANIYIYKQLTVNLQKECFKETSRITMVLPQTVTSDWWERGIPELMLNDSLECMEIAAEICIFYPFSLSFRCKFPEPVL